MDRIDERNNRDRMKSSIIKRWQVRFVDPKTEEKKESEAEMDEDQKKALEIYERLQREAEEDEAAKRAEQQAAYEEAAWMERTKADGLYGQKPIESEEEREQIESILNQKNAHVQEIIDNHEKEKEQIDKILAEKEDHLKNIVANNRSD